MTRRVFDGFAGPGGAVDECWTGIGTDRGNGYVTVKVEGRNHYLHRLSYEHYVGPIPDGLVIDHLCRNRACYNPVHLEPVTNAENILRGESPPAANARKQSCSACGSDYVEHADGRRCLPCKQARRTDTLRPGIGRCEDRTHCPKGHAYDAENTRLVYRKDGSLKQRKCRECDRASVRARRARTGATA